MKASTSITTLERSQPHHGITMHKLQIGIGFPALLFAVGSSAIFLIGLPSLWVFVAMAVLWGIGIAAVMRYVRGES